MGTAAIAFSVIEKCNISSRNVASWVISELNKSARLGKLTKCISRRLLRACYAGLLKYSAGRIRDGWLFLLLPSWAHLLFEPLASRYEETISSAACEKWCVWNVAVSCQPVRWNCREHGSHASGVSHPTQTSYYSNVAQWNRSTNRANIGKCDI